LVASPTHDIVQLAHQQLTREWWVRRDRFDLFVSTPVLAEASRGDPAAAARRLETLKGLPVLSVGSGVGALASTLLRTGTIPRKARLDAIHVAIAAVNGMDYLLTWNLRHLANAVIRGKIEEACRRAGITPPILCTPEELIAAMRRDPIVEEVRRNRAAIAREHGNDLDAIVAAFQREEASADGPVVSFSPKVFVNREARPMPAKSGRPAKAPRLASRAAKTPGPSNGQKRSARG
jgi:hypothetical protein